MQTHSLLQLAFFPPVISVLYMFLIIFVKAYQINYKLSKAFVTHSYVRVALESGFYCKFNNDIHDIHNPRKIEAFNLNKLHSKLF